MSVKKIELPVYDPRGLHNLGLMYATSVRRGDHINSYMTSPEVRGIPQKLDPFKDEGNAMWTKAFQDLTAAIDSFRMCIFTSFAPVDSNDYAALIMAATGMEIDGNEVMKIGERI